MNMNVTGGIIALDLFFPDSVQFFAARPSSRQKKDDSILALSKATNPRRQKLRGKLRIVASHPTKVNHIEVKFLGQTELTWRDPLKSQHSILAERMNAHKTFRKSKSILLQDATLPSGVTELGFEITIPGHLYPTFKSKFVDIRYTVIAKVIPNNSKLHKKPIRTEKEIILEKTLMPQDVASGQVAGYVCPRIPMRGTAQRDNYHFIWEFKVPKWVSLDQGLLEFDGVIGLLKQDTSTSVDDDDDSICSTSSMPSRIMGISKIEVDVVQQSFYHYETSEENPAMILLTESPMAFSDRLTKRHLTLTYKEPSTYLHPPLETPITFSFPIHNNQSLTRTSEVREKAAKENISHRVKSLPYVKNCNIPNKDQLPPSCIVDTAQFYAPSTTISKDSLSFSLDSPFLEIRHYIRLIIYPATSNCDSVCNKSGKNDKKNNNMIAPICIGLPIHITQNVSVTETEEDALPSYSSISRGAEELPDYDTSMLREEQAAESDSWDRHQQLQRRFSTATTICNSFSSNTRHRHRPCPSDEIDLVDLYNSSNIQQGQQQTTSSSSEETVITVQQSTNPFTLLYGDNATSTNDNNDSINDNNYNNNSRLKHHEQHVLIQERRLEDFSLI